jgi:hypothetical protein
LPDQGTEAVTSEDADMHAKDDSASRAALIPNEERRPSRVGTFSGPQRAKLARGGKVSSKVSKLAAHFMSQGVPQELAHARAELHQIAKKAHKSKQKKEKKRKP